MPMKPATQAIAREMLQALQFADSCLAELVRLHTTLWSDKSQPETYGRYLLLAGTVVNMTAALEQLRAGRLLPAQGLQRMAMECTTTCWYLTRRDPAAWSDWASKDNGQSIIAPKAIREELARDDVGGVDSGKLAILRAWYSADSTFVHPTRARLETLLESPSPGMPPELRCHLSASFADRAATLVYLANLMMTHEFLGCMYNDPWPGQQAAAIRIYVEQQRQAWAIPGQTGPT